MTADMLATMRSRLTLATSAYQESRTSELEDLRFMAGSPDNKWQWPDEVLATRGTNDQGIGARPCLTLNKLPIHVRQVTNDQRQNRPAGKVIPVDGDADIAMAEVFDGIIRHIEYMSDADSAYDTACENQVTFGEGYIGLLTEYCSPDSFDQDIRIRRIRNSFSVYMDPTIQDPCGSDAQWCFITQDMTRDEYERSFPDAKPISSLQSEGIGDPARSAWLDDETVRIAEYFYIEYQKVTVNLWPGNLTTRDGTPQNEQAKAMFIKPLKSRVAQVKTVKWIKTNGYEVLEERDWAGQWIPVVRVVGNEFEVDGQIVVSGLIRNAKDAQRMYNYWASQEAEMLALAPKAPFIGYGGQFEGYENQWKTANTTNWPYLEVNPDVTDGAGGAMPLPQRAQPPMASSGLLQAKAGAAEDIKGTTGQFDASLGMQGNERSGKAILARQKEGDTGTYHYVDNLARAIRHITRQIVDLIPKIYDTERVARIIGLDGEVGMVKINPDQPEPVKPIMDASGVVLEKIYNPSVGLYDVMVTTGPSYMTKRQEALEAMAQLLQTNTQLWAVAGDLFIKNMDWPGAQEMAARFKKMIDPKLLTPDDKPPELQAAEMKIEQQGAEMQQMAAMLKNIQHSFEEREMAVKEEEARIKAFDAETKRLSVIQASMSPEQIQDIVVGTVHGMITSGDLLAGAPEPPEAPETGPEGPPMDTMPPPDIQSAPTA